jgi:biotin transporter BioY
VAFVAGWLSERGNPSFTRNIVAAIAAEVVLFASGIAWLQVMTGSWQRALAFGFAPFLSAEVLKVMVASAAARKLQHSI